MNINKYSINSILLVIFTFLSVHLFLSFFSNTQKNLHNSLYDHLLQIRYSSKPKPRLFTKIVHIDLNDETINDPFFKTNSVDYFSKVVEKLGEAGIEFVVFDIFFDGRTDQKKLIEVSKKYPIVYHPIVVRVSEQYSDGIKKSTNILKPIDPLVDVAKGLGHISMSSDNDGVVRRYPLLLKYDNKLIPSMALKVALDYYGLKMSDVSIEDNGALRLNNIKIPAEKNGELIINFTGKWYEVFPHYSIKKILFANEEQLYDLYDELEGSIAIVSDTSTWGKDFTTIPLEKMYPLSGVHSTVLKSILSNDFIYSTETINIIILTLLILLIAVLIAQIKSMFIFTSLYVLFIGIIYVIALVMFLEYSVFIPVSSVLISVSFSFVFLLGLKYFYERWQKSMLLDKFSGYFSPSLMDKIIKTPELINSVEEKELTILFSDIAGFTSWCNKNSPQTIHKILNEYYSHMVSIVFKHNGTIDKYIGDGLMVIFGDPEALDNPSKNAVNAAIEMQKSCEQLRQKWGPSGVIDLHIRIGINYGKVVVGNMGSENRMDYTALGSHVNLAQRLESKAPKDGILVSNSIIDKLDNLQIKYTTYGKVDVKGFDTPVNTYVINTNALVSK